MAKKFRNKVYVKCKEGWVIIKGGNLDRDHLMPSHKFIDTHLNRDQIIADQTSQGVYQFGIKSV